MKTRDLLLALTGAFVIVGCSGGSSDTTSATTQATADTAQDTSVSGDTTGSKSITITTANPYPAPVITEDEKEAYLKAINDFRAAGQDCGSEGYFSATTALTWNDALYTASYEHSNDMAEHTTMTHDGSGLESDWTGIEYAKKSTSQERIENNDYMNWKTIGENVAYGQEDLASVMDAWISSPGHCKSIMNPDFIEVGMSYVEDAGSTPQKYWTQNFGSSF